MKHNIFQRLLMMLIPLFMSIHCFAQEKVGTTSFQFLKIRPDARATAMGDAVSSLVNTAEALFSNPAGIAAIPKIDASVSYYEYFFDVKTTSLAGAFNMGAFGTLGLQAIFTGIGDIEVTSVDALGFIGETYNPGLTGETVSPTNLVLGITYARGLTEQFSFGITAKYVREDLVRESAATVLFDGGLIYKTGFRSLQTSVVLRHFGPDITFVNEGFPPPQTLVLGVSGYIFSPESALFGHFDRHKLLVSFDLVGPRDFDQQYNLGFEYGLADMFFLRGGYKANYDTEGLSLGFGLRVKNFRGDYSYNEFGDFLPEIHKFTLGISLN